MKKVDFDIGSYTFAYKIAQGMTIHICLELGKKKEKHKILDSFAMEGKPSYHFLFQK